MEFAQTLEEWAKDKPLSILQLDPADRAVLRIADERDAIQKKTFTKWVNKHLTKDWRRAKCGKRVGDLFEDLRDGHNLVSLLEVLSGEHLPRERGRMRFHMLQNVQTVLDFLRYRKIKLVNIRAEDIVDGNPKLTLGLIWTIILHFQISDIVVGMEENVSAKDVLLKWAQRSTAKYPDVRVGDFTKSWRDGLAFNAIIHRNRPDLIDWRALQRRTPRERLETAFSAAERECGVTRLLDPEDVDTPQPDEKSLITYISSLYDAFPEPPRLHPLHDTDSQKKSEEYRETASVLYTWIRESIAMMQDRNFSTSLIEMRRMAADMNRFRVEEVPSRAHSKQRLSHLFRDVEKNFRDGEIDRELHIENVERSWQVLMMSHQEKDQAIHEEIKKLEKLQRMAEKVHQEGKQVESRLDDHEQRIDEEARRIDRLHPLDAKNNVDHLERDMQMTEEAIKSMFNDTQTLSEARFHQASELNRMVQHLHQRWITVRTSLRDRLQSVLDSISFGIEEKSVSRMSKTVLETRLVETDPNFRNILEVSEWIKNKQKQLNDADYGSDLPSVQAELEKQQKEHRVIERYETNIERCSAAKSSFRGEELQLYITYLNGVQKSYAELIMSSKKRQSDLETLMDFVQSGTNELIWLSEKEEREIVRDWSSKNLSLVEVEQYYEALMSELEKREIQFNAVQDRGESLVLQHHPASKCIETYMSSMQTQWAWLLQLTLCLETHLKYVAAYQQYFSNVRECEQSIARQEELLNSIFSQAEFTLDEGEVLLKEMQGLRNELTRYGEFVQAISNESGEIIPLKQRKINVSRPLTVTAICNYRQNNQQMVIAKDERCVLLDNSQRVRWRVRNSSGLEGMVPGVCFLIPPPDKEAIDAADRIRKQYDRCVTLWQKKQLKMRQNMIFATIKVVKSWDLTQFLAMGTEQRNAIRKALNEDAEKLIQEGDPNDPALRRLRREIDEVNRLFDQFEKEASDAEKSKNTTKLFTSQIQTLQMDLEDVERILTSRVNAPIPRDLDNLERIMIEHKDFESKVDTFESRIQFVQKTYSTIPQKTPQLQAKMEKVIESWERIWNLSHRYVELVKVVEVVLNNLEETNAMISKFEIKLGSYENLPTDEHEIRKVSEELFNLQNSSQMNQHVVEDLVENTKIIRHVVEQSRGSQKRHSDLDKLEDTVRRTTTRWANITSQIEDRMRSVEETAEMATRYNTAYQKEMNWLDTIDTKTKSLPLMDSGRAKNKVHPHMTLYNSVIEEKVTIEQVNSMGARLAKEAKNYDDKLEEFRTSLEPLHPGLDINLVKKPRMGNSALELIRNNLDLLNLKYQVLVDNLFHRLQQLSIAIKQEEPSTDFSISKVPAPSPLRTYRSGSRDLTPLDEDTVDNNFQRSSVQITLSAVPSPKKRLATHLKNGDTNGNAEPNGNSEHIGSPLTPKLHFSQIHSSRKPEEGISTETAILVPLLIDPLTREKLTLAQAIGCGLIDIKTGEFIDPKTNRRLSLTEAVEHGYILDSGIVQKLLGVCGLIDTKTGNELTLLDAIRLGWYDLTKGCFINPKTGEPMSSEQVIRLGIQTQAMVSPIDPDQLSSEVQPDSCTSSYSSSTFSSSPFFIDLVRSGRIDLRSGQVTFDSQILPLTAAATAGLVQYESQGSSSMAIGLPLTDLIDQGLVSKIPTGEVPEQKSSGSRTTYETLSLHESKVGIKERFSGEIFSFEEAVDMNLLNPNVTEVFDPNTAKRITVTEAIDSKLLDPVQGTWNDIKTQTSISVSEARGKSLIMKPLTLKDCVDMDLLDPESETEFLDPITHQKKSLLEAIAAGNLDYETKTISDTETGELLTLQEALANGVVTTEGLVRDTRTGMMYPLRESANRGLLSAVRRLSVFDIPCIMDPSTNTPVSVMEAVKTGIIDPKTKTIKVGRGKSPVNFDEAGKSEMISSEIFETLNQPSGIYDPDSETELTILEAIVTEKLLPSGEVFNEKEQTYVPMDFAVENESLNSEKADALKSLYNINLTTTTVTKTRRHLITIQRTEETLEMGELEAKESFTEEVPEKATVQVNETFTKESTVVTKRSDAPGVMTTETTESFWGSNFGATSKPPNEIDPAVNREILHLPSSGWPLREMIRNELFEPVEGLFEIPGTDRLVSFEECVRLKIIDPASAEVIDPSNGRRLTMVRALEKQILNKTGQYHYSGNKAELPLTLQEAIATGAVVLLPEEQSGTETSLRVRREMISTLQHRKDEVTSMEVEERYEVSESLHQNDSKVRTESATSIVISDSMTFNPVTATVRDNNEDLPLFDAIRSGKIDPTTIKFLDGTGQEMTIDKAMEKGIVDKRTGDVKVKHGNEKGTFMSFADAVKFGAIAVVAAPVLAVKAIVDQIKTSEESTVQQRPRSSGSEKSTLPAIPRSNDFKEATFPSKSSGTTVSSVPQEPRSSRLEESTLPQRPPFSGSEESTVPSRPRPSGTEETTVPQKFRPGGPVESTLPAKPRSNDLVDTTLPPKHESSGTKVSNVPQRPRPNHLEESSVPQKSSPSGTEESTAPQRPRPSGTEESTLPPRVQSSGTGESIMPPKPGAGGAEKSTVPQRPQLSDIEESNLQQRPRFSGIDEATLPPRAQSSGTDESIVPQMPQPSGPEESTLPPRLRFTETEESQTAECSASIELTLSQRPRSSGTERRVSATLLKSVPEEIVLVSEEVIPLDPVITTTMTTVTSTSVVITKMSRLPVDIRELESSGLVDQYTMKALTSPDNFKGPDGQRLTIEESIALGKIDANSGALLDPQTQQILTISEALVQNILTHDGNIVLPIARSLCIPELPRQGLYDSKDEKVIHPETGSSLTILEALASDVLNPLSPVKHPVSNRRMPLAQALDENVICNETGGVNDPSGQIPLLKALQQGVFAEIEHPYEEVLPPATLTMEAALKRGLINEQSTTFQNPTTNETVLIQEAISKGILIVPAELNDESEIRASPKKKSRSPPRPHVSPVKSSAVQVTFKEPIKSRANAVVVPGYAQLDEGRNLPLTVEVDLDRRRIRIPAAVADYSFAEALEHDVLNPNAVVELEDGSETTLKIILEKGMNLNAIKVKNVEGEESVNFTEALKLGLLAVPGASIVIGMVPATAVAESSSTIVAELGPTLLSSSPIPVQVIEIRTQVKKQPVTSPAQEQKVQDEEVDVEVEDETSQFLSDYRKPFPLHVAIALGKYNPNTGLLQIGKKESITLESAIRENEIDPDVLTCRDPRTNTLITLRTAIDTGIVNPKSGQITDLISGAELNFVEGTKTGLLLTPAKKISLAEAIYAGNYDPNKNFIYETSLPSGKSLPLKTAIEQKLITVDTLIVKNFATNSVIPFKVALAEGMVHPELGTVQISPTETVNIVEALETGILLEVITPLSLTQAIHKGLYREEERKWLDPKTAALVSLGEALERRVIDPETVHVMDTREGFNKKMPLTVAIQSGFVSGDSGTVHNFTLNTDLPLLTALEQGLIVDSKMPVSLQRAIERGIYSEESGKLVDPNTGNIVTLHESIRRLIVNPSLPCYWDENQGKVLSLVETCRLGIIGRQDGVFHVPKTEPILTLNLAEAMDQGHILNIEKPFTLYEALKIGLYEKESGKFIHPSTGRKLTLEEACKQELIISETSILKNSETLRFVPLQAAIVQRLVDPIRGTYIHPNGKGTIKLDEAKRAGLVLTTERPLPLEHIVREHLYDPGQGKIGDPLICEWLSTEQALNTGLVDSNRTAIQDLGTQRIKSLRAALDDGDVNSEKGTVRDSRSGKLYPYNVAAQQGFIITVDPPLAFSEALKTDAIDLRRGTFYDIRNSVTSPLAEAVIRELIDPTSAVVRDPLTQDFVTLRQAQRTGLIDLKKRALIDSSSGGKLRPLVIIFEQGTVVFLREPMSFDMARDKGYLNLQTGKFQDPLSEGMMTLKEAIDIQAIEPKSALVKDVLKKRLVSLSEGYTLALIDPEKSTVFNSATNHLMQLNIALDSGLLLTPRNPFGLITALDFSLYNPSSGKFINPYDPSASKGKELTLYQSLEQGLIEPNTTVIRDRGSRRIVPLTSALEQGIVDGEEGTLVDPLTSSRHNLLDAWKQGLVVPAEARLATEEKFRTCSTTINNLMDWLTEVEKRLGMQDSVRETLEEIKHQLTVVKTIRNDIDDHAQPVGTCLDQMRQLVATGSEILSIEEISTLEKNGKQLRNRFDKALEQAEKLDRKLTSASDELRKYRAEVTNFKAWMDKSYRILEDKERNISNLSSTGRDNTKEFVSDVIAHQGDLRFITMSAQKFIDESRNYLQTVNDFRANLPQRQPYLEAKDSSVKKEVTDVATSYQELLSRSNKLFDRISSLGSKQKDFQDAFNKATAWLKEVTPRAQQIISEPVGGEPNLVQDQLSRAKALQNEILSNGRLIDSVRQATNNLLNSLEDLTPEERHSIENATSELESRYHDLIEAVGSKVNEMDSAFTQSQDVQDSVENVTVWLTQAENQLKVISKPASLIRERLDEQIREVKMLHTDIESHRGSIENMARSADKLINSGSRVSKRIEGKLQDVMNRHEKLVQKLVERSILLNEVSALLSNFDYTSTHFEHWFSEMFEIIETKLGGDNGLTLLEEAMIKKQNKKSDFDELISSGKNLVTRKDVTDTTPAKDKIKSLEQQWKDLNGAIDERSKLNKTRSEQFESYEKLRDQVVHWLSTMEIRIENLHQVALDTDVIRNQVDELKPIIKEHRDYNVTIDRVNDFGNAYDSIRSDRGESPRRMQRLPSVTTKRANFRSTESPTKATSPSSFGSRRSSQDPYSTSEESTPVQAQLSEINSRYNVLGTKLSDRQHELDSSRDDVKKIGENLKSLAQFLDKIEGKLPKESIPQSRDEAEKVLRGVRNILEELYDKQGVLDSTKTQLNDILSRKPMAIGSDDLRETFDSISKRWKAIQDKCKLRVESLQNIKEFHDSHDGVNNWLNAKEKMMGVLGPIASDPRMVQNQLQQVQVMRDEFRAQKPTLDSFNNAGDNILAETSPDSIDGQKIEDKLMNINQKWNDILHKLDDRETNLDAASGASADFYASLNKLQDNLHKISDDLDDLSLEKGQVDPEELLKKLQTIDQALASQRPVLADVQAAGEQLCDVLTDSASQADIKQKSAQVGRLFNQCQKKLDNCKAEAENSKKDAAAFDMACESAHDWLQDTLSQFMNQLLVSADRDILQRQVAENEPIYKAVMAKEHEIIMIVNKGKELASSKATRLSDQRTIAQNLEKIQKSWDKVKKEAMLRNGRLQTCLEQSRKYVKASDNFVSWLTQAEDLLESMKLDSFKKADIDKQLKEMSAFKNDLWRHTNEYETTRSLGETFLTSCDKDKQGVTAELRSIKQRWDILNNVVLAKVQELEDAATQLHEFNESIRDFRNALNRCEDRLASADDSKDPKLLQKIRAIVEEASKLERPLGIVKNQGDGLCKMATQCECNPDHINEVVEDLLDRYQVLNAKLDDRGSDLEAAQRAMMEFNEQLRNVAADLGNLEDEFSGMKSIGRDIPTVKHQIRELREFSDKLSDKRGDIGELMLIAENLIKQNIAVDPKGINIQLENLKKQLARIEEKAKKREKDLQEMEVKLEAFYDLYQPTDNEINELILREKTFSKGLGGDVESIRNQQSQFIEFRSRFVEAVGKEVEECNKSGQALIQSASNGVSTAGIEGDLEKLNEKWNNLKEKINDQERKLDVALLNSGKFQEALEGLNKWLDDIEDMVANQKPPSADFKVVKAQLQEQKFLNKMLLDRQPSMQSLFAMGREIAANANPADRHRTEQQLGNLGERYDTLWHGAQQRHKALEEAMEVAKDFQEKLTPLTEWLDRTGKKIKDMSLIPTDEDKIQKQIREHDALHDSILGKQPEFSSLADIAAALMELVGDEEATIVADKLQDVTERYGALVEESEALSNLLKQAKGALRHLVLSYEELIRWMDDMNKRLGKLKVVSVHKDKLLQQMDQIADLSEEIKEHEKPIDETMESGLELMQNIPNDEAIQLKDKLDSLQRRFNDISNKALELLKTAQEALPLVTQFHDSHNALSDWMLEAESVLQGLETSSMTGQEKEISRLEREILDQRIVLEQINLVGPQLCHFSPGEGASTIEGLVSRDNRRFDAICEQVQRRAERIYMAKQRSMEVLGDIDDLLEWFHEIEGQIKDAEKPSCEPDIVKVQLQEQRALNDEIASQKGRVRDVLATAKKVVRESALGEDTAVLREKAEDLREMMDSVSKLSSDRLNSLEQALPLAEHFVEAHHVLNQWMDVLEDDMAILDSPAIRPDQIVKLQDKTQSFLQTINEHKPLVDKLNKTGTALSKLCNADDAGKVEEILNADNERYNALRAHLREKQQALEKALQETSQFKDKLDGMINALESTADQVNNAEPISAHPDKIREQIEENAAIIDDVKRREDAFNAVTRQANDVIKKAPNQNDPAIKDIKQKLDRLNNLWDQIQKATKTRGKNLEEALQLSERFWSELQAIMEQLDSMQDALKSQEPPSVEPITIQKQQDVLQIIKKDIEKVKPEVGHCRSSGQSLIKIIGEQDKPEIKKNIEELDSAWDNITALFAKREENLIDAMEKAMEFHDTLHSLLHFLDRAENRLAGMGGVGTDIETVKKQIAELKDFKLDVDPMMVKVEALNRQAQELTERTTPDQAAKIKGPLAEVNRRWDDLLKGIVDRQRELENALLRLGQFQHALNELMAWIDKTHKSLETLKPVFGDPQVIEVELAKLKVVVNDIQAHQNSVDTLNDAGRQIIESEKGSEDASKTQQKLGTLNKTWDELQRRASDRQGELEDALRDAQAFASEIQDLLFWLNDIDGALATSKPVGGLPETAAEQLFRFMEIYNELETNRPKVEAVLQQGQDYLKKSTDGSATNLTHNLKTLRQRWESVMNRANDKKIKLEIALKEANEFHKAVQDFIDWLTEAERYLTTLEPVSRVLDKVVGQVDSHRNFQKEVSSHREVMLTLEKKGNHLKYFSQKQDVILIKNLLISVQHRWDRVVSKSTERTRGLDLGLKEAKEFHDNWASLCKWLDEADKNLDDIIASAGNNPVKIKQMLAKHKEFQRLLASKQPTYDATMRMGKSLKDKAPKTDELALRQMLMDLKNKWNTVCSKSVERQRNLEEALLKSGQFKDALQELLDWLKHVDSLLVEDGLVHGDLDTVTALVEQHKKLVEQVEHRQSQMKEIVKTAKDLMETAAPEERARLDLQIKDVTSSFDRIKAKCGNKTKRLEEALKEAEKLHKSVHMLLDWLSDAEMRLRFAGSLPEDEDTTKQLLEDQEKFMRDLFAKEREKDETLDLARSILSKAHPDAISVIKHWVSIIQSRWDEISSWAKQRENKLQGHLASLRDMEDLLEELMNWLKKCEDDLTDLEAVPLPDDLRIIQGLIKDHKEFMESMAKRQVEVDSVCKPKALGKQPITKGKPALRLRSQTPGDSREPSPDLDFAQRRLSSPPGREKTPDVFPHIGPRFDRKGSKAVEPQIKNPKVKGLWDKWKNVWMMAWERQRRLQDKHNYLMELEKVKNFSWDDWRKRFLKFMNYKKSRVTDIFRKIDRNNNGLIPREEFIDAIIKTKFSTSRLEMNAVADMFDHGDNMIDYMEFIAALRPDWEEKKPETEADMIDDEVQRQVMKCTCRQKFRVFQVGEGKYRFGDSQKLRLVRILRSTVMVRVGGGWVALDEFLVKNDPCRAKGRTNIELREQFILADGVSQTMQAFKSRPSGSSASSGNRSAQSLPTAGPITKVKERSIRSVPMGRARSTDRTTPESTFSGRSGGGDDGFTLSRVPRKSSAGAAFGRGSTPGSRTGSKPPSRSGSNLSLDSNDQHDSSRIPRRSTLRRGGSGNVTPTSSRLQTTPTTSRPPFSLNTNAKTSGRGGSSERAHSFSRPPSTTPRGEIKRAGSSSSVRSLPTSTGSGQRPSRIPVFVGGDTGDFCYSHSGLRSRTPSNSNIPLAASTPRERTPSGQNVSFSLHSPTPSPETKSTPIAEKTSSTSAIHTVTNSKSGTKSSSAKSSTETKTTTKASSSRVTKH